LSWHLLETILKQDSDPITDFFNHDWAAVGGWSLFIGLVLFNVVGIYRGWVVPGWMYRDQGTTLSKAMDQNRSLLAAADITAHFFKSQAEKPRPRRPRNKSEVTKHDPEQESAGTII
jgi:hypothetical protein